MRRTAIAVAAVAAFALLPLAAHAGTLCGTVRDQSSGAPVANAGVFVRTPAGAYTGLYGATDLAGAFCIASVPAGTYDLEVLVDHYQVAYVRGVVVTTSPTSVDVPVAPGLRLSASPNPARGPARIAWVMPTRGPARVTVVDLTGRVLREWAAADLPEGEHALTWDVIDRSGHRIGAGVYFIRLDTTAGARRCALVLLP